MININPNPTRLHNFFFLHHGNYPEMLWRMSLGNGLILHNLHSANKIVVYRLQRTKVILSGPVKSKTSSKSAPKEKSNFVILVSRRSRLCEA